MKKIIILSVLLIAAISIRAENKDYSFRKTTWNMTQAEVIKSEEKITPFNKNQVVIAYQTTYYKYYCKLIYFFNEKGKLTYATYFMDVPPLFADFIFKDLVIKIINKHGKARGTTEEFMVWKDKETNIGMGLSPDKATISILFSPLNNNELFEFIKQVYHRLQNLEQENI